MKILITGYKGFLGRELTYLLRGAITEHEIIGLDLKDGAMGDIMFANLPDADVVIHLAAQADVQSSIENPFADAWENIMATIRILRRYPKAKIIYTSSAAAIDPKSPYGISKRTAEDYVRILSKRHVICRLPNLCGYQGNGVFKKFSDAKTITIFGDGKQTRDFVHVRDIAAALCKAIYWKTGTYELGSGKSITINELARMFKKPVRHVAAKKGEIKHSAMKNTTPNWKPIISIKNEIRKV